MKLPGEAPADARMARSAGVLAYLPWLLAYPLRGHGLPVLLLVTLFMHLGLKSDPMQTGLPLTGIPMLAITAVWSIYYLLRIIRHSARGHALPPPLDAEAVYLIGGLKPLLLPAFFAWGWYALRAQRPDAAQGLLALAAIILPLYLFILATEEDQLAALNPLRWLQTGVQLGLPYAAAVAVLALGVTSLQEVAAGAARPLLIGLLTYLAFGSAHLLGYLGFQRHSRLGLHLEVRHPDLVAREREQGERLQSLLVRIENCLQHQDEAGAAREIAAEPGGPVSVPAFFEELLQRMQARGTAGLVHAAGRRLISVLLAENRAARALAVAELCLNRSAHFEPQTPAQLETLLREALISRYPELFERLARNLEQRYPGDALLVSAQFLRAQLLAEQRGDEAAALALLRPLLAETRHPLHARIKAYASALERLESRRGLARPAN